jgi:catechol 2,3-dioxygenase-like lactoylglutathione lyase family enzyme
MLPIRGLYEVAIRVRDLEKSEIFYREALGLEVGLSVISHEHDPALRGVFSRS